MPELYPGQVKGVRWMSKALAKYKGCILADRPGWGKTAQAIEIGKKCQARGPVLVICPAYIIYNWLDELTLWGIDRRDICVIDSTKQILDDARWYVVSYNMASHVTRTAGADGRPIKKPGQIFTQLYAIEWGLIIADEYHALKTPGAQRSRLILGTGNNKKTNLLNKTYRFIGLTGTPLINRVDEIYNLVVKIAPSIFKGITRHQFILHFAAHIENTPWGLKHRGVKNVDELKKLIVPVMLSRSRIDGLPDRIDRTVPIKITGAALKAFIKQENEFIQKYHLSGGDLDALQKAVKLEGPKIAELRQQTAFYKIPVALQAIAEGWEKGENILIGVYHRKIQDALYQELVKKFPGKKIGIINGGVDKKKRHAIIAAYQAGEIDCILTTISAMREGVNVTRGFSVYILEYPWTPAELEQFIARVHRKGQDKTVYVHYFAFQGGIDAIISRTLKTKKNMINKIMEVNK